MHKMIMLAFITPAGLNGTKKSAIFMQCFKLKMQFDVWHVTYLTNKYFFKRRKL